jgi:hypothetical protein
MPHPARTYFVPLSCLLLLGGCSTIDSRISGRTATEQYLITSAIDRAVDGVKWDSIVGRRVFVEIVGVQVTEFDYMHKEIDRVLLVHGAQPVEDLETANVRLTVMVQAVGTDIWLSNFGVPLLLAANPATSGFSGITLYQSNLQEGYCRLQFYATNPRTGEMNFRSDPVHGDSYFKTQSFLGFIGPFKSSDIFPERKYFRPQGYEELREKEVQRDRMAPRRTDTIREE